jgi:putative ABC transport system permease protein
MDTLIQDLRYAVRSLLKSPGFTVVAVLTLALGIGANTAIFTVINAVLLKPLPYRAPERLVTVWHLYPSMGGMEAGVSVPGFRDYSAQVRLFERAAVQTGWNPNLTGQGEPERLNAARVSADWFAVYGVAPLLGRTLRPDEAVAGNNHVVVLSHGMWNRMFGGDRGVIGRSLQLDGESFEIVGVMPPSFKDFFNRGAQLWSPILFRPEQYSDGNRTNEYLSFTARLKPGITAEAAAADLHAYARQLRADFTDSYAPDWDLLLRPLPEQAAGGVRPALYILLGAVGFVLLIACANVANLQLARTAGRAREIAVRVALGASPRRLMAQLLTESMLLALIGGALGLLVAVWGVPALLSLQPPNLPPAGEVGVDLTVLGFALAVSLGTGLLFGIMPSLHVARANLHELLKEGGRGAAGDRAGLALRRGLVVTTVALALTLLAGAGLLVKSFARLTGVDPGFRPAKLLTFQVALPRVKYPNDTVRVAVLQRITDAVTAVPGVVAAGGTSNIPFGGNWSTSSFSVEGFQPPPNTNGPWGDNRAVTRGYLPAIGVSLLKGRQFTDQDREGSPAVAIVDDELVRRYWPGVDPIGKRITYGDPADSSTKWIEVVGVVRHTLHEGLDAKPRVQVYRPLAQRGLPFLGLVVRTTGEPMSAVAAMRAAVRSVDPDVPLAQINTMEALIEGTTGSRRFSMLLLGGFAALAMILASIGLYGVMSYMVTQRSRELGVRVALGANTRDVLGLVLGQGAKLAFAGVAIGLVASFAVTRVMTRMLFDVSATDPVTFVVISLLLIAVALLASYLPARRATKVDPIVALRAE